ncbi:MAG: 30S ribosomal protein THX [Bacteroidia bacterium]|nr:30S ribosomal protein THX [Bacteroidia bacterium]
MGKGDKKSAKGKRWRQSFGKSRNRRSIKARLERGDATKVAGAVTEDTKAKPARKK